MQIIRTPEVIADHVLQLYKDHGSDDYIGESISQLEHMLQCAQLAEETNHDEEVILAAFFHDIGHLCASDNVAESMNGYGVVSHEKIGADYLRQLGFSEKIARLVKGHVQAKRYLAYATDNYYDQLSEASKKTLEYQGGIMTEEEANDFEQDDLFVWHVEMRIWDDKGKIENMEMPDTLDKYRHLMIKHLNQNNNNEI